jgi:hypothetical protein
MVVSGGIVTPPDRGEELAEETAAPSALARSS